MITTSSIFLTEDLRLPPQPIDGVYVSGDLGLTNKVEKDDGTDLLPAAFLLIVVLFSVLLFRRRFR
jgi:hypothetical protein